VAITSVSLSLSGLSMTPAEIHRLSIRGADLTLVATGKEDAVMTKRFAAIQHAAAEREKRAASSAGSTPGARENAVRDEERASDFSIFGDPLWGMAIISAALFAVLAALIAAG
jgi:hypothetical protein